VNSNRGKKFTNGNGQRYIVITNNKQKQRDTQHIKREEFKNQPEQSHLEGNFLINGAFRPMNIKGAVSRDGSGSSWYDV